MTIASRNHVSVLAPAAGDVVTRRPRGTVRIAPQAPERPAESDRAPRLRRSPRYPAVNLKVAVDRATALYRQEGRNVVPNEAILAYWGYAPGGPGFGALAALKRFGLLRSEGPGRSRLSELALRIVLDEREGSRERAEAVREAALTPAIHRELWDTYPDGLPSDTALRRFLCRDRGFTETAADKLIKELHETVAFARLGADHGASQRTGDDEAGAVAVRIPLSPTEWVTLRGRFPLSQSAWDQLMRVLEAMKPGMAAPGGTEAPDGDG